MVLEKRSPLEEEEANTGDLNLHWGQHLAEIMCQVTVLIRSGFLAYLSSTILKNLLDNTMVAHITIATKKVTIPFTWRKFPGQFEE